MPDEKTNSAAKEPEKKPHIVRDTNYMAVERTIMAADRSLMAWVRTGLSLISFGFTIYKFLEYQREQLITIGKELSGPSSPRVTGLLMIGIGVLCLILGTLEYLTTIKEYRKEYNFKRPAYSLFISAIIAVIGILLFIGIFFKINGIG